MQKVTVIGAGLAGCEAAWQLANRDIQVRLIEMKPTKKSPAHELDTFGELVCSNSLRSDRIENAVGLLKEELRTLNSLIMKAADASKIPAGGALAVDRKSFSKHIDDKIRSHKNIIVEEVEVLKVPDDEYVILATGPLTSDTLAKDIAENYCGEDSFYFYDAVAPIVDVNSIDMNIAFKGSRYDRGDDYINCPMTEDEYNAFYQALISAETAPIHEFEENKVFEGCMPIESMAKRGRQTMSYGPLKPVGIMDPRTGKRPYAVVQLRQDNAAATMYNIVGFQTKLKVFEQQKVFSMIPGLENVKILRYGVMHRNTYINAPQLLTEYFEHKDKKNLYFAGQMMGVEGYVESVASGMWAGLNLALELNNQPKLAADDKTMIGAIVKYTTNSATRKLTPMNANFGIIAPLEKKVRNKKDRAVAYSKRAMEIIKDVNENLTKD